MKIKFFLIFLFFSIYVFLNAHRASQGFDYREMFNEGRVVASPFLSSFFLGGDNWLAANFDLIRMLSTGHNHLDKADMDFLLHAHAVVAKLNPCHEDNYYVANGLLTWGGAVEAGNKVLEAAVKCRTWDYVPPFFYGINLAFFQKDNEKAAQMLEIAAERSPENHAALLKTAAVLRSSLLANETLALNYLRHQRDSATDAKLREMLDQRVVRLEGLLTLRAAQKEFEAQFGDLAQLEQLLEKGFLTELPKDPLRLGYELKEGQVELKKLRVAGLEN